MTPLWKRASLTLLLLALLAWFAHHFVSEWAGYFVLTTGLVIWLIRSLIQAHQVNRWGPDFPLEHVPQLSGWWEELVTHIYRLQKQRQQELQRLHDESNEFRHMIQAMPDGVVTLNENNQILWCNQTASQQLGLSLERDQALVLSNLVRHPDFLDYLNSGQWETPVKIPAPALANHRLSIQIIAYGAHQKLLLSRDITRWEKLETMRRDFVANVSHELKTPLTVVSGFLETLREHDLPAEQIRHFLQLMHEQSSRMENLVQDLLALSSLESSEESAVNETIHLKPLFSQLAEEARALSQKNTDLLTNKAHEIIFEIEEDPAIAVLLGAMTEIQSAFSNLISNAIRYTPSGGKIHIRWHAMRHEKGHLMGARFSVQDSGIGIEVHHIPRLTERFYRVDRGRSRESGGTGLGLAIVKHVLMRHEGELTIHSTFGQGSTFSANFPLHRLGQHTLSADTAPKINAEQQSPTHA